MPGPWKPQLEQLDLRTLPLSPEEAFVASRLDGRSSLDELGHSTGLGAARVEQTLARLLELGAVRVPEFEGAPPGPPRPPEPLAEAEPALTDDLPEEADAGLSHLALYQDAFHALPGEERARLAQTERGARLSALCFDPLPAVIHAVLQNPLAGPEQARLIAAHHRNTAGLEWLLVRADLARDAQVQRLLWRNPQLNESQLRRLVQSRRMLELWKLAINREATAQTRAGTAKVLRTRFQSGASEEKVEVILATEGRCLAGLSGIPLDGKSTALLCARSYASLTLVQNLANWAAAPPALIAHLLKQPIVARSPQLKAALGRHPNAPKRG